MGKTKFKIADKSQDPSQAVPSTQFKCSNCPDLVAFRDLDDHAKKHGSNSLIIDYTYNRSKK